MSRPAFTLLICPDAELCRREFRRLLAAHGAQNLRCKSFSGDEPLPAAFWQDLASRGLLGGSFDVGALFIRRAEQLPTQTWKELEPYLNGAPQASWPFFCLEVPWERGKPKIPAALAKAKFMTLATERDWLWSFPGLSAKTLPGFVRQALTDLGLAAAPALLETLCQRLPEDAAGIDTELAKLALAGPTPRTLTPQDLTLLTGSRHLDLWQVLEAALQGRDRAAVWREVLGLAGEGSTSGLLFPLLAALGREARGVGQLLCGEAGGLPPWLAQKKSRLAERLGHHGLGELLCLAMEAELAVKSGEKSEDQALEELVAGLYALCAPAPARC